MAPSQQARSSFSESPRRSAWGRERDSTDTSGGKRGVPWFEIRRWRRSSDGGTDAMSSVISHVIRHQPRRPSLPGDAPLSSYRGSGGVRAWGYGQAMRALRELVSRDRWEPGGVRVAFDADRGSDCASSRRISLRARSREIAGSQTRTRYTHGTTRKMKSF